MTWRERWASFSVREKRLVAVAGGVLGLLVLRVVIVSPFLAYRDGVREEIETHREWLANAREYLARAAAVTRELEQLRSRYATIHGQLVPGEKPAVAAAALQTTLDGLAGQNAIEIRSTQVMRDEAVDDFVRVAIRMTVTGELESLANFLSGIEYHPSQRMRVSYFEISKRGAVLRGQGPRVLSATIEVAGFIQGEPPQVAAPAKARAKGGSDAAEAGAATAVPGRPAAAGTKDTAAGAKGKPAGAAGKAGGAAGKAGGAAGKAGGAKDDPRRAPAAERDPAAAPTGRSRAEEAPAAPAGRPEPAKGVEPARGAPEDGAAAAAARMAAR